MKKLRQFLPLVSLACTILALILFLALPAVIDGNNQAVLKNGAHACDGFYLKVSGKIVSNVKGSGYCVIMVVLFVAAIPFSLISMQRNKAVQLITAILLLVASIFAFCTTSFILSANQKLAEVGSYSNGSGPILAGLMGLVGVLGSAIPAVLGFIKHE